MNLIDYQSYQIQNGIINQICTRMQDHFIDEL